jgi:hypothetical protein
MTEPEDGVHYPLYLGESFKNYEKEEKKFHTFQYNFVPESVEYTKGEITISPASDSARRISVEYPMGDGNVALLEGPLTECKETDCILIFDGKSFRLERVTTQAMGLLYTKKSSGEKRKTTVGDTGPSQSVVTSPSQSSTLQQLASTSTTATTVITTTNTVNTVISSAVMNNNYNTTNPTASSANISASPVTPTIELTQKVRLKIPTHVLSSEVVPTPSTTEIQSDMQQQQQQQQQQQPLKTKDNHFDDNVESLKTGLQTLDNMEKRAASITHPVAQNPTKLDSVSEKNAPNIQVEMAQTQPSAVSPNIVQNQQTNVDKLFEADSSSDSDESSSSSSLSDSDIGIENHQPK